jgi:hypothetical protein
VVEGRSFPAGKEVPELLEPSLHQKTPMEIGETCLARNTGHWKTSTNANPPNEARRVMSGRRSVSDSEL